MNSSLWLILLAVWLVCGIASLLIARSRGATNTGSWFLVGALFGPFGITLALIGARSSKGQPRYEAIATLRELADLRSRGALSDEEYEAKRADVLSRV